MAKSHRLNVRFYKDDYNDMAERAEVLGFDVQEYVRFLIEREIRTTDPSLLDTLSEEIIHTAVSTHYLIVLMGGRSELPGLTAKTRKVARALGVHHVD